MNHSSQANRGSFLSILLPLCASRVSLTILHSDIGMVLAINLSRIMMKETG